MAPGRRRGAKGAKAKSELRLGDLVLAKVKGFPAWPAKISKPEDWERTPDPKKYFVQFFGTSEIAFVAPGDIQAFTSEAKIKLSARCQGKTVKYFAQAVKEICEAFEEIEHKKSSGLREDTDRSTLGGETSSVDGLEDEAVEIELKDDGRDGTNVETEINELGDHSPELEHCSPGRSGMGCQDIKPSLPCKATDNVISVKNSKLVTPAEGLRAGQNDHICDVGDGQKDSSSPLVASVHAKHSDGLKKAPTNGHKAEKMSTISKRKPREQAKSELSGRKKGPQLGPPKHGLLTNDFSDLAKKSKRVDLVNDAPKGLFQTNKKIDSLISNTLDKKADNSETKLLTSRLKTETHSAPKVLAGTVSCSSPSDEDALPPMKRRRHASEAVSDFATTILEAKTEKGSVALKDDVSCSDNVKSQVTHLRTRRRAVRVFDEDDEEEPKTPVHGGSSSKIPSSSFASDCGKSTTVRNEALFHNQPGRHDGGGPENDPLKEWLPSAKLVSESSSPNPEQPVEKRPKKAVATQVLHSPGKPESERVFSKEAKQILISPKNSPCSGNNKKSGSEPSKANRPSTRVSCAGVQKKTQTESGKALGVVSDGLNYSQNQVTTQRTKPISSGEIPKSVPKSHAQVDDSAPVTGSMMESNSFPGERLEAGREDKTSLLIDSKISDSAVSMKHLIAAAQAKRRQSHSQNISHGNASYLLGTSIDVPGRSPSPASAVQPFLSGSSNVLQPDVQGYYPRTSMASPSHGRQFSSNNQTDAEEFEERRVSSGHRPAAGGSLSGGTEAAVARDAFEGMIETLSRTKESIGRATRLAIDCAKYGIANEVVELLIRKLENEPSLHRKVDLFFLVDSITQCSHSHKGIAGASYIPTVQAALPRLLGAAAPSGAAARENRRQCLKVLRLWLERKILPEPLLRRYMDDVGVSNDDSSAGFFLRRPSRAERAVDDPIREMEGMLVDEYGSNATFQLPGFLTSRVFEDDEEEDLLRSSCKEAGNGSPAELVPAAGEPESATVTPNDRRHCILEDVDGELEMEDVSGHLKDERLLFENGSVELASPQQGSDGVLEAASNNSNELALLRDGSPPLPVDSPPLTPPLPPSPLPPPSPPPPPSSPSPPPPPPPPPPSLLSVPRPLPPPTGPQSSLITQTTLPPQPLTASQQFHQPHSIPSSSPKLTYQPLPHEHCSTPNGNQLVQMAANTPHGGHIDAAVRSEMFPQQSPCFAPAGACNPREPSGFNSARPLDYGHQDLYINSQASQSSQQFQPGNATLTQRSFHPAPPPQTSSGHYSYPHPSAQQHPYPRPYSLPNLPDGPRRYVADEQWRMPSSDYNTDSQRGAWVGGGRAPTCSGPPFAQEGYFRPPFERPPTNSVGFQPSAPNTLPAGAPVQGHSGSQMMPCRPDVSALNCWRP